MGFFKRRTAPAPTVAPTPPPPAAPEPRVVPVLETPTASTFVQAVSSSMGRNSEDIKVLRASGPGAADVLVFVDADRVTLVESLGNPFPLAHWMGLVVPDAPHLPDLDTDEEHWLWDARQFLSRHVPDSLPLLDRALADHSLRVLLASRGREITQVAVSLLFQEDDPHWDVLNTTLAGAMALAEQTDARFRASLEALEATDGLDTVPLEGQAQWHPQGALADLLRDAVSRGETLGEFLRLSDVFPRSEVEGLLSEGVLEGGLDLGTGADDALPTVSGDFVPARGSGPVVVPDLSRFRTHVPTGAPEGHVMATDDDDWEFGAPPRDTTSDDGDFDFEQIPEEGFPGLGDTLLVEDISTELEREEMDQDLRQRAQDLARENASLEIQVGNLEPHVRLAQGRYLADLGEYRDLALEQGIQREEGGVFSDELEMDSTRTRSDSSFFDLEPLERKRHDLNSRRDDILAELETILTPLGGDHIQGLIQRVEEKRTAIKFTVDEAFHDPRDTSNLEAGELLGDSGPVALPSPSQVPLYMRLVGTLGIDPLGLAPSGHN